MRRINVYGDDYFRLVRCYQQHVGFPRSDWDAIFSCNPYKEAWPCHDRGYSHHDDREYVQTRYLLLRKIVEIVLTDRPDGGRFFIKRDGVFVKPDGEGVRKIASFDWGVGK